MVIKAELSDYAISITDPLREGLELFQERKDGVFAVDLSIGSVKRPMPQQMQYRMGNLMAEGSPFADGSDPYTRRGGLKETQDAFRQVIRAKGGVNVDDLEVLVTMGGSEAMEVGMLMTCREVKGKVKALLTDDPTYANYPKIAHKLLIPHVALPRQLQPDGTFTTSSFDEFKRYIQENNVGLWQLIKPENPGGKSWSMEELVPRLRYCVEKGVWVGNDAAYELLEYGVPTNCLWEPAFEKTIPGLRNILFTIESSSKVFNFCGGRVGSLVTANKELADKARISASDYLCAPCIDQWIFGAMAHMSTGEIHEWIDRQKSGEDGYINMMHTLRAGLLERDGRYIITQPEAAIYSLIKLGQKVPGIDTREFMRWCASEGFVEIGGKKYTALFTPADGFYQRPVVDEVRVAYTVRTNNEVRLFVEVFDGLVNKYQSQVLKR